MGGGSNLVEAAAAAATATATPTTAAISVTTKVFRARTTTLVLTESSSTSIKKYMTKKAVVGYSHVSVIQSGLATALFSS